MNSMASGLLNRSTVFVVVVLSFLFLARNLKLLLSPSFLILPNTHDEASANAPQQTAPQHDTQKTCYNSTLLQELIAQRQDQIQRYTPKRPENQTHWPTFFKNEVKLFQLARRQNYLTPRSGCHLARWVVRSPSSENYAVIDCHLRHETQAIVNMSLSRTQENDTIYIPFNALQTFVRDALPQLSVDIILITGQWQSVTVPNWNATFARLIENPHVLHIFCMHKPMYAPIPHPKITSWPLGLNFRQVQQFSQEFMKRAGKKQEVIFYSKLGPTAEFRSQLPSGKRLKPTRYYQKLHHSHFILAPSGLRPDSFRMYEALGLGAKPITNLDPSTFEHYQDEMESIVFGVDTWNPKDLTCHAVAAFSQSANRRMVFDEYWMEYVERRVGIPLNWFDHKKKRVSTLDEIVSSITTRPK